MAKYDTPRVPIQTPMYDEQGRMTRAWVIFFERLGGRGGGRDYDKATFNFGLLYNVRVLDDQCPHYLVRRSGRLIGAWIECKTPPTGNSIIVDLIRDRAGDEDSFFGDTKLVLPAGETEAVVQTEFATDPFHVQVGDVLKLNVEQVGSTIAGRYATVVAMWEITSGSSV